MRFIKRVRKDSFQGFRQGIRAIEGSIDITSSKIIKRWRMHDEKKNGDSQPGCRQFPWCPAL
jgi:hypothetical protein